LWRFRHYWRNVKLTEAGVATGGTNTNKHAMLYLDTHACNASGFESAARMHQYQPDQCSIVLYNKDAQYEIGMTPLLVAIEVTQVDMLAMHAMQQQQQQ
jgi:hypothetical protein